MKVESLYLDAYSEIRRLARGEGSLEALVPAFRRMPEMIALPPSDWLLGHSALYYEPSMPDPLVEGRFEKAGFYAFAFTREEFARKMAISSGRISPYQALLLPKQNWATALYTFLTDGYAGVVIDPGTSHEFRIDRNALTRLVSLLTFDTFVGFPEIHAAVCPSHAPHFVYQGRSAAIVYDCRRERAERALIDYLLDDSNYVRLDTRPARYILEETVRAGIEIVLVNPGLSDWRWYLRKDLEPILELSPSKGGPDFIEIGSPYGITDLLD